MKATSLVPLSPFMNNDCTEQEASKYDTFAHFIHEKVDDLVVEVRLRGEPLEMLRFDVINVFLNTYAIIDHLRENSVS